jgi:hypothetical protein
MALVSSAGKGRLQDRIEDALAPGCQSVTIIAALLAEINDTGYSHPSVNSLRQKHSRLQTTVAQSFNSTTQDSAAHSAANAEDQWRRRSVQASANFFLQSGSLGKVGTPTLASFGEAEGEEGEEEEEEEQDEEEEQHDSAMYGTPAGTPAAAESHDLMLTLRVVGHGTPATLRVLAATSLLDIQRAIAEFLRLGSLSPDEIASIKLFAHDPDFDEEVRVTDLDQLRESFADCVIIPKDSATDEPLGMGTSDARAVPSSEEGIPPQQTPIGDTVLVSAAPPHKPPSKVVSRHQQLCAPRCNKLRWNDVSVSLQSADSLTTTFTFVLPRYASSRMR